MLLDARSEELCERWCRRNVGMAGNDFARVNETLGVAIALERGCGAKLVTQIEEKLRSYQAGLQSAAQEEGRGQWASKARLLDAARAWGRFPLVSTRLRSYGEFRGQVREKLKTRGANLAARIKETKDCDDEEIQRSLAKLKEVAALIDVHVDGEAAEQAARCEAILEAKRAGLDENIDRQIRDCDFANLVEYLGPSVDDKRLGRYRAPLQARFRELVASLRSRLESEGDAVAWGMPRLREARTSGLGDLLGDGFDVDHIVKTVEAELDAKYSSALGALEASLEAHDFPAILQRAETLRVYTVASREWLRPAQIEKYDRLARRASESLGDVHLRVTEFLDAMSNLVQRKEGKISLNAAATALERVLCKLGTAALEEEAEGRIAGCYRKATGRLCSELKHLYQKVLSDFRYRGKNNLAHAIHVLEAFAECLGGGLRSHVGVFFEEHDVTKELDKLRQEQIAKDADLRDAVMQYEWPALLFALNKAKDEKWTWTNFPSNRLRVCEYNRLLDVIKAAIDDLSCSSANKCFLEGNFELLKHISEQLGRLDVKLDGSQHRDVIDYVRHVRKRIESRFSKLVHEKCGEMVGALDEGKFERFAAELFPMCREMMLNVVEGSSGDATRECRDARNSLATSLCRFTKSRLDQFEALLGAQSYAEARDEAQTIRSIGIFMLGPFALYASDARDHGALDSLASLRDLCHENFGGPEIAKIGRCYARFQIRHDAAPEALASSYRRQRLKWHPDKNSAADKTRCEAMFNTINEEHELLEKIENRNRFTSALSEFSTNKRLAKLEGELRSELRTALNSAEYERAAAILARSSDVGLVSLIASPSFDADSLQTELFHITKAHVDSLSFQVRHSWGAGRFDEVHLNFAKFDVAAKHLPQFEGVCIETWFAELSGYINDEVDKLATHALQIVQRLGEKEAFEQMPEFALRLIRMGRILDGLPRFKDSVVFKMTRVLDVCQEQRWGFSYIFKLGLLLEKAEVKEQDEDERVGKVILSEFGHFKDILTMVWNQEVVQTPAEQSVMDILSEKHVDGDLRPLNLDRDLLLERYEEYEREYDENFRSYISPDSNLSELARSAIALAETLRPCQVGEWTPQLRESLPKLLGRVFALFTILKSGDSFNRHSQDNDGEGSARILLRPHNIQVLTILRLFGCDDMSRELVSHVMQIRTGEGKSMILGACSALLSLLGFRVRCVCYSEYLSSRDLKLFEEVFAALGVENSIAYTQINSMSEDAVRTKGDLRELTLKMLRGESLPPTRGFPGRPLVTSANLNSAVSRLSTTTEVSLAKEEILLVDEVDVFFGSDFYGSTYTQIASFEDPAARAVLSEIWRQRASRLTLADVRKWGEYRELRNRGLPEFVVDAEVSAMCRDVCSFAEPPYHVDSLHSRIGYTAHDGVDYSLTLGYRTAFAYLHEAERGSLRDSQAALKKALCLRVVCGQFSHANISPACVLGVSGTLDALTSRERDVMKSFGIEIYSSAPSVYGRSNLSFDVAGRGILLESTQADYFHAITEEIRRVTVDEDRAVIVFFADDDHLAAFKSSPFWAKLRRATVLTSTTPKDERDYIIKKATTAGFATLSTAVFGRGTDFFCKDHKQHEKGGAHVIQTFLSIERSEEIQIRGRTARQGKRGSYCMILLEPELEALGIDKASFARVAHEHLYDSLDRARVELHDEMLNQVETSLVHATAVDGLSHRYLDALVRGEEQVAKGLLAELYARLAPVAMKLTPIHAHFLIDVSGSMQGQRLADAKAGVSYVVDSVLDADRGDSFSLASFSNDYMVHMDSVDISDKSAILQRIASIQTRGGTELYASFLRKLSELVLKLQADASNKLHYLFVFTDGADTSHGAAFAPLKYAIDNIPEEKLKCALATVGLHPSTAAKLGQLAESGKLAIHAFNSAAEINDAFERAAEDIVELVAGHVAP